MTSEERIKNTMLKATIDKNENTCYIELAGNSLELANDLSLLIMGFTKTLIKKHSIDDAMEIVIEACSSGVSTALKESK